MSLLHRPPLAPRSFARTDDAANFVAGLVALRPGYGRRTALHRSTCWATRSSSSAPRLDRIGKHHRQRVVEYAFCDLERHLVITPIGSILLLVPNPAQDRTSCDYKVVATERSVNPGKARAGRTGACRGPTLHHRVRLGAECGANPRGRSRAGASGSGHHCRLWNAVGTGRPSSRKRSSMT